MTQTPNIGLKKIDGSENWRSVFDYHNDSMDLADEAIAGVRAGLTYVENGDTIAANADYTEGKFIAWKGEIYRILTTINTTVTSANWTTYLAKQDGIGGALSALNSKITKKPITLTPGNGITISNENCYEMNGIVCLSFKATGSVQSGAAIATIPSNYAPPITIPAFGISNADDSFRSVYISSSGNISAYGASTNDIRITIVYML